MKEKKEFGLFIQEKRKNKGLSQMELASKLYVTESAVSKWERGVTYPDITMISDICQVLEISEHEFLTASNDIEFRKMKNDARRLQRMRKIYFYAFTIMYLIAIISCFICNLAVDHTLSWFFIVLSGCALSFTIIPTISYLIKNNYLIYISGSIVASLLILLFVCSLNSSSNWFFIPASAILLVYVAVFLPIIIKKKNFFNNNTFKKYYSTICIVSDYLFLNLLLFVIRLYTDTTGWLLVTFLSLTYLLMIIIVPILINKMNLPRLIKSNYVVSALLVYYLISFVYFVIMKLCYITFPIITLSLSLLLIFIVILLITIIRKSKFGNVFFRKALIILLFESLLVGLAVIFSYFEKTNLHFNLLNWSSDYINGNTFILLLSTTALGVIIEVILGIIKLYEGER